jgi:hypothetical protein
VSTSVMEIQRYTTKRLHAHGVYVTKNEISHPALLLQRRDGRAKPSLDYSTALLQRVSPALQH